MGNTQIYIIYILQSGGFGIVQYLFECERVEYYGEDREIILKQFWETTGLKPEQNKVVDVQESRALYYSLSHLLK